MMSEAKARKLCLTEAQAELARRDKENANTAAAKRLSTPSSRVSAPNMTGLSMKPSNSAKQIPKPQR